MELTEIEKAMIEAYRNGANVDVTFFNTKSYEDAVEQLEGFGGIDQIDDITNEDSRVSFVAFKNLYEHERLEVRSFVDVKK